MRYLRRPWPILAFLILTLSTHWAFAQGPTFTAQIENFWRLISTGGRTFSTLRAVNVVVTGTCTGCSAGFPLLAPDGTSVAPSYAFASQPGLGWFRSAAGRMQLSTGAVVVPDGLATAPSLFFNSSDQAAGTGFYKGTNNFGWFWSSNGGVPLGYYAPDIQFHFNQGTGLGWTAGATADAAADIVISRNAGPGLTLTSSGTARMTLGAGLVLHQVDAIAWGSSGITSTDLFLTRDAAGILSQRNGTNAQIIRIYKTFTDASNYVRLVVSANPFGGAGVGIIQEEAGTGTTTDPMYIGNQGTGAVNIRVNNTNAWTLASGGGVTQTGKTTTYNNIVTAGWGTPAIQAQGRVVAATNTGTASVATYTVGAADGTFEVGCNVLITTSTTFSFSCDTTYTDEGNTARTMVIPIQGLGGNFATNGLITNALGAGPYESATMTIRAKAATAITIRTSAGGTFTTVVYNIDGTIKQVS